MARICENFSGHMLLISDHGMHAEAGGGEHGTDCEEDMLAVWGNTVEDRQNIAARYNNSKEDETRGDSAGAVFRA